jgi:hypothetical protein
VTNPDDAAYRDARAHVRAERVFYQHLIVYAAVMGMLFLINATTSPNWWVQWPAMGWGLLLVLHGVFTNTGLLGPEWEERRVAQLMRRRGRAD